MIQQHTLPLRLFVASVWLILLTFYMFMYAMDPTLARFGEATVLFVTALGFGLFGLTYWLLKQAQPSAASTKRPTTPAEKIFQK